MHGREDLIVPWVVHFGNWNDLPVLVLDPLPVWLRRRPLSRSRLTAAMCEIAWNFSPASLASAWTPRLIGDDSRRRSTKFRVVRQRGAGLVAAGVVGRSGTAVLSYGSWHGDWTPWNMAITHTGLLVWDWERLDHGVPVGFDALPPLALDGGRHHAGAARPTWPGN